MHRKDDIQQISNITQSIANPAAGDWMVFDIDDTLLLCGISKYHDDPQLTESGLAAELARLRESGIKVIGLTARGNKHSEQTLQQLTKLGIVLDEVLHAPTVKDSKHGNQLKKGQVLKDYVLHQQVKPKRLFVFDDKREQLENIQESFTDSNIPLFCKRLLLTHYQPICITAETDALFPAQLQGYQKKSALGGGTNSVFSITNDKSRQTHVLKYGAHEDAAKIEILCNAVYRAMGVKVPKMRVYHYLPNDLARELKLKSPAGMFQVSELVIEHKNQSAKVIREAARNDFAAHVLLGNIDVAKQDNFIVDQNGDCYLIDAGANFMFRAKGKIRKEHASLASEMDSLRDEKINASAKDWFGDLTDAEIEAQVNKLIARQQEIEKTVWEVSNQLALPEELRHQFLDYLSDRFDQLVTRFCQQSQPHAKVDKKAIGERTAAGILTYTMINNEPHLLLSKRVRHEWWDNFGGKSDASDTYLADTAVREVAEESSNVLNYMPSEILTSPFHDIVTEDDNKQFVYRMYLCHHDDIDLKQLKDAEHTSHQWVPVKTVMDAVTQNKCVTIENKQTVMVNTGKDHLAIYPPLYQMLQQPQVAANLQALIQTLRVKQTHTLGYASDHAAGKLPAEHLYRPFTTPAKIRQEVAAALQIKSDILSQLKKPKTEPADTHAVIEKIDGDKTHLSQSEIHLKSILGSEYRDGELEANVRCFIEMHTMKNSSKSDAAKKEKLVQHCVRLLENEKHHGENYVYFYHGCNHEVSFAYDVYSALYQALNADSEWQAFRPDSEHFKRFANIGEFIHHYSSGGKNDIDNNAENFNDCALSTNVFLFGNHETPSSNSLEYMIDNDVRRPIDMKSLFTNLLQPFHVPPQQIKRILQLFNKAANRGGSLYQIAIPKYQVRDLSYPAGSMGIMNGWQGSRDVVNILRNLQTSDLNKKSVSEYISKVQARLMLPPNIKPIVQTVRWVEVSEQQEKEYRDALHQCVQSIMYLMLRHHSSFIDVNRKTAMIKILPHILAQNQLSLTTKATPATLAKAILANDASNVSKILKATPEYLEQKLSFPKAYINHQKCKHDFGLLPLEMIILHSTIPLNAVIDSYGEERCFAEMRKATPDTIEGVIQSSLRVPDALRLKFVSAYPILMHDSDALRRTLEILPLADRFILLDNVKNTILQDMQLATILRAFPESDRIEIAESNESMIRNSKDLASVVKVLAIPHRLDFAIINRCLIKDFDDLICVCFEIPETDRMDFIKYSPVRSTINYQLRMITELIPADRRREFLLNALANDYDDNLDENTIEILIILLPEDDRMEFAVMFENYITSNTFYEITNLLPEAERIAFVNRNKNMITTGVMLIKLLDVLPAACRLPFAVKYQGLIHNDEVTHAVFKSLPPADNEFDNKSILKFSPDTISSFDLLYDVMRVTLPATRIEYAKKYHHLITDSWQLLKFMKLLPEELRARFAMNTKVICDDEYELDCILKLLPDHLQNQFEHDRVHDANTLNTFLKHIPLNARYDMARAKNGLIKTADDLAIVLKSLAMNDRYYFTLEHRDKILTPDDSQRICVLLPDYDRDAFEEKNIKSPDALFRVLSHSIIEHKRFDIAVEHEKLIQDIKWLNAVLELLPAHQRFRFAMHHRKLPMNGSYLYVMLELLPEKQRYVTASVFRTAIKTEYDVMCMINLIGPELRSQFAILHHDKFKHSDSVIRALESMQEDGRLEFAVRIAYLIQGEDLVSVVKLLPPSDRFGFAAANIKNLPGPDAIKLLSASEAECFATLISHTIREFSHLATVLPSIPESKRVDFLNKHKNITPDNIFQLKILIDLLPEGMRDCYARSNIKLITSKDNLLEIMKMIPQESQSAFDEEWHQQQPVARQSEFGLFGVKGSQIKSDDIRILKILVTTL